MPFYAALSDGPPWWAFLFMPLMMLGMALMMWFMMRMMMGHDMGSSTGSHGAQPGELETLRAEVARLNKRLAAMESTPGEPLNGEKGSPGETESTSDRRTENP